MVLSNQYESLYGIRKRLKEEYNIIISKEQENLKKEIKQIPYLEKEIKEISTTFSKLQKRPIEVNPIILKWFALNEQSTAFYFRPEELGVENVKLYMMSFPHMIRFLFEGRNLLNDEFFTLDLITLAFKVNPQSLKHIRTQLPFNFQKTLLESINYNIPIDLYHMFNAFLHLINLKDPNTFDKNKIDTYNYYFYLNDIELFLKLPSHVQYYLIRMDSLKYKPHDNNYNIRFDKNDRRFRVIVMESKLTKE